MTLGLDIEDRSQDPDARPVIYRCLTAMVTLCFPELVFRRRSSATLANAAMFLETPSRVTTPAFPGVWYHHPHDVPCRAPTLPFLHTA